MNGKERTDVFTPNEAKANGKLEMTSGQCASNLEIASSPFGEVKISLSCNLALVGPDFQTPSLQTVLQSVEEKCIRSYKNLDPNFSVMNIMEEICQSFLNVQSDQNSDCPSTIVAHPTPTVYLPSNSSATDDLCADGLNLISSTGANDPKSNTELPLVGTSQVTSSNGMDYGCHLEKRDVADDNGTCNENKEPHAEETNDLSLVVADQPVALEMIGPLHDVFDIAKGQEKVIISLVNEVNSEPQPSFYYIPQNVAFQNAFVNLFSTQIGDNSCSTCSGNCLLSPALCKCAHLGGDFAYTVDGLLKEGFLKECISMKRDLKKHNQFFCKECPVERSKSEDIYEPCKGHLMRKFIKECWLRCGCDKKCGNRVVQRGISCNLQVAIYCLSLLVSGSFHNNYKHILCALPC